MHEVKADENSATGSKTAPPPQPNSGLPKGANKEELGLDRSNIVYNNSQQNSASKSLATLGHGNITVSGTQLEQNGALTDAGKAEVSALAGLNRDTANTDKNLWNSDYEQHVDATIDHRMFSERGQKEIAEDLKRTQIGIDSVIDDIKESSVSVTGSGEGETSLLQHLQNKQDVFTGTKVFASDPANAEYIKIINSGNGTPEQKDAAYTALANSISQQLGIDPVKAMTLVQDYYNLNTPTYQGTNIPERVLGAYAPDPTNAATGARNGLIMMMDDNLVTTRNAVNTVGHEVAGHHLDYNRNPNAVETQTYHDNRENYADLMGDATVDYLNFNFAANDYDVLGAVNLRNGLSVSNPTIAANNARFNQLDPGTVHYRQLDIPEIRYVREADRVQRFADHLRATTGENLTTEQAQARLLQGAAGLMDAQWQKTYGTDAVVMDFLMDEIAGEIKTLLPEGEVYDGQLEERILNSDIAYVDPRTGESRVMFTLNEGEYENERQGVVEFMAPKNRGLVSELHVDKTPQQRALDRLAGQTQGQSDTFSNPGAVIWDGLTGALTAIVNLIDTITGFWPSVKEFASYGSLLDFQGRDQESGYLEGQGIASAAIGTVGSEAMGAFGGALLEGALTRAKGGTVLVNADASGQATGFSMVEGPGDANLGAGKAAPNLRYGDGDDAALLTSLVDQNREVVLADGATNSTGTKFGPHEIGPLGNPNDLRAPASTFRSGTYTEKVAETDMYFYRDYGGKAKVDGRYWTPESSWGPLQSQLDSAILPEWGNTFENQAVIKVPAGTKYYEGPAAPQVGTVGTRPLLQGGGAQIFLPNPKLEWIIKQ